ncbi:MAG: ABC transporter permease, partial [Bacteroidales bacterium]|nr:ABC transporter permease [Bacteroidales bacterium]
THLNMTGSLYTIDDFGNGQILTAKNLILPAFALGIRPLAVITELTRASLLDVFSMDYIKTAKAKGLSNQRVIFKHALKNSLNPVISSSTGWFASMLAGSVFVEYVFDWKGMGTLIVDALDKYDMPVLMGCIVFISLILIILNIFADILYAIIDPKVKLNE